MRLRSLACVLFCFASCSRGAAGQDASVLIVSDGGVGRDNCAVTDSIDLDRAWVELRRQGCGDISDHGTVYFAVFDDRLRRRLDAQACRSGGTYVQVPTTGSLVAPKYILMVELID